MRRFQRTWSLWLRKATWSRMFYSDDHRFKIMVTHQLPSGDLVKITVIQFVCRYAYRY